MGKIFARLLEVRPSKFTALFFSLLFLFLVSPFVPSGITQEIIMDVSLTTILISAIYAVSNEQKHLVLSLLIAACTFLLVTMYYLTEDHTLLIASYFSRLVFFTYVNYVSLTHIMKDESVSMDTIFGCICVYFLLGLTWAHIFSILELIDHGSFAGAFVNYHNLEDKYLSNFLGSFVYYSFVTLTTLGYGDLTPVSLPARTFAMLEAIVGQLYLTILVARLVGLHIRKR